MRNSKKRQQQLDFRKSSKNSKRDYCLKHSVLNSGKCLNSPHTTRFLTPSQKKKGLDSLEKCSKI